VISLGTSTIVLPVQEHLQVPVKWEVPRWQSHRRSGLATLPSVGAVP